MGSVMNGRGDLILKEMEAVQVLNALFTLIITGKTNLQQSQVSETTTEVQGQVNLSLMEEDQLRGYLKNTDMYNSLGPAGMHLQGLMSPCQLPLERNGNWERFLRTGRKPMSYKRQEGGSRKLTLMTLIPGKVVIKKE